MLCCPVQLGHYKQQAGIGVGLALPVGGEHETYCRDKGHQPKYMWVSVMENSYFAEMKARKPGIASSA